MRRLIPFLLVLYAVTCCSASADSIFKFEATVAALPQCSFCQAVGGFDVKPGDKISGTFNYGTPGQSNPSIQALINGVEYSADVPSFSFHADFVDEGLFRGIGGMDSIDARMGIWMQGAGDAMIGALTGCHNYYDCPTFDGLPASFPFLHQTGAAQLQIRSAQCSECFGFPINPAAAFSSYYLNADLDPITKVSEPPTLALLLVGLALLRQAKVVK